MSNKAEILLPALKGVTESIETVNNCDPYIAILHAELTEYLNSQVKERTFWHKEIPGLMGDK